MRPGGVSPKIYINDDKLTGVDAAGEFNSHRVGGIKMEPIPGDFLRSSHEKPQVIFFIVSEQKLFFSFYGSITTKNVETKLHLVKTYYLY